MNPYDIFGIYGVDLAGDTEQRLLCPQPACRNRQKNHLATLSVNIAKGIWHCPHCRWSGTVHGDDIPDLSKMLPPNLDAISADSEIGKWFADRGITELTLEELGVLECKSKWTMNKEVSYVPTIVFQNTFRDKVVNAKMRNFVAKDFRQLKGGYKLFYNLEAAFNQKQLIITEGEIDVLTLYQCDIRNAVSVPDGAPAPDAKNFATKFEFLDNSMKYLHSVETFIIAVDTDKPGLQLRELLASRLGKEKCSFVDYPFGCKDLNDVLVQFGVDKVKEVIQSARPYPLDGVFTAEDLWEQVMDIYQNGYPEADKLHIGEIDDYLKFRTKRLYVWTGIPNHGKTVFVDMCLTKLYLQGWKSIIYSPETERVEHISRQIEQLIGKSFYNKEITPAEMQVAKEFLAKHCYYILTEEKNRYIDEILEAAKVYVQRFGVNSIVIDPFNTVEYDLSKYDNNMNKYIGHVLDSCKYFAKKHDVAVHIIAHPTKMLKDKDGYYIVPQLYDISDSQHWNNKADVGIAVYKRYDKQTGFYTTEVYVQKVKHKTLGRVGNFSLQFDTQCERYYTGSRDKRNYLSHLLENKF